MLKGKNHPLSLTGLKAAEAMPLQYAVSSELPGTGERWTDWSGHIPIHGVNLVR